MELYTKTTFGLQDPESPSAVLVLRLFAIVFEVMAKYNVKTDDVLLPVFPRLIARTQELAAAAKNPSGATCRCCTSAWHHWPPLPRAYRNRMLVSLVIGFRCRHAKPRLQCLA